MLLFSDALLKFIAVEIWYRIRNAISLKHNIKQPLV